MKKARVIEIPDDRPLTMKEHEDFTKHGVNSCIYTLSRGRKSEKELRDKLRQKGYIDGDVEVQVESEYITDMFGKKLEKRKNPKTEYVNIIHDVIQKLEDMSYIDDAYTAELIADSELRAGKGPTAIKTKLMQKGFPQDIIEDAIEEAADDESVSTALQQAADKYMRTSTYTKEPNAFIKKQKLMKRLVTKGFSFSEVNEYFDDIYEYLEQ